MSEPKDNFRSAVERIIWAHSYVDDEDRAEVLRQFADELEAEESPFDEIDELTRKTLKQMGYEFPAESDTLD